MRTEIILQTTLPFRLKSVFSVSLPRWTFLSLRFVRGLTTRPIPLTISLVSMAEPSSLRRSLVSLLTSEKTLSSRTRSRIGSTISSTCLSTTDGKSWSPKTRLRTVPSIRESLPPESPTSVVFGTWTFTLAMSCSVGVVTPMVSKWRLPVRFRCRM